MDHANCRLLAVEQRHQRAPMQEAHDEASGAVDGVQHPSQTVARLVTELLSEDAVARVASPDGVAHHLFGCTVGFRYRVIAVAGLLVVDGGRLAEVRQDRLARAFRELTCEIKKLGALTGIHGRSPS